jgi:hypothetical protein
MSRRTLLGFCALGVAGSALVLGGSGAAAALSLPPITLPPAPSPPLVQTPPTVSVSPDDGLPVALPPVGPDGDGVSVGLPGFPSITTPVTLPTPTTEPPKSEPAAGAAPQAQAGPAATARTGNGGSGATSAGPTVTVPGAPHIEAAQIDGTSARVVGAIDGHHHSGFWSAIGSAAVTYWFGFALCLIALVVRFVAIAAWRDRMRASD